jgi:hypothetical protein
MPKTCRITLEKISELRKKFGLSYPVISTELVKEVIANKKGQLNLNWEYTKAKDKFFVKCDKNHIFKTSWDFIQLGMWCPNCAHERTALNQRIDELRIRKYIENKKGRLDENWEYVKNSSEFFITCDKGHKWRTTWNRLSRENCWCEECKRINKEKEVINFIDYKGGKILNKNWKYVTAPTTKVVGFHES